jgi:hypothetical protein
MHGDAGARPDDMRGQVVRFGWLDSGATRNFHATAKPTPGPTHLANRLAPTLTHDRHLAAAPQLAVADG